MRAAARRAARARANGPHTLKGTLRFQACNDQVCLAPVDGPGRDRGHGHRRRGAPAPRPRPTTTSSAGRGATTRARRATARRCELPGTGAHAPAPTAGRRRRRRRRQPARATRSRAASWTAFLHAVPDRARAQPDAVRVPDARRHRLDLRRAARGAAAPGVRPRRSSTCSASRSCTARSAWSPRSPAACSAALLQNPMVLVGIGAPVHRARRCRCSGSTSSSRRRGC